MLNKFRTLAIPEYAEESFKQYHIRSDRLMLALIVLQWFFATFITAISYNTYLYGFIGGALITGAVFVGYHYLKGSQAMRVLVGISMMLFSLIYIQQHFGRIEMHFHVFIAMGLLTVYKDFVPILAAAVTTVLHHLIFNYLQLYEMSLFDMPVMIFNYGCGIDIVMLHAIFVATEAVALAYIVRLQVEHSIALHLSEKKIFDLNSELQYTSLHDDLTELPNRQHLEQQLKYVIKDATRHKKRFAVLFLDLDHFKSINDTLGHGVGDVLLQTIAKRIKSILRQNDLFSRIGGDEFILVITDIVNENSLVHTTKKILDIFHHDLIIQGHALRVSASIGISIYPDDAKNISDLMKFSDMAMYKAKEHGRDDFSFFTAKVDRQVHEEVELIRGMQLGVKRSEFCLYYQPKLHIKSGQIIGAEALIRWNHPEKGLVFPDKFIPIAEKTGIILKLGSFVIDSASQFIEKLNSHGIDDINISINVSARQFQKGNLYQELEHSIANRQMNAEQISIEITESILMESVAKTLQILEEIKKLNVKISIDDFGTGYSSLAYLKEFPIDELKIDKTFIDDIQPHGDNDSLLLNTIIAMGKSLNFDVIAEGVEEQFQIDYIQQQGCNSYQGYFFSRPIPEDEFINLLKNTNNINYKS